MQPGRDSAPTRTEGRREKLDRSDAVAAACISIKVNDSGNRAMVRKSLLIAGILLILAGVFALAYRRITYITKQETIQIGPVQARVETKRIIPLPPIVGALALAGGVALVIVGVKKP